MLGDDIREQNVSFNTVLSWRMSLSSFCCMPSVSTIKCKGAQCHRAEVLI